MPKTVYNFSSDHDLGAYLSQVETAGLSANIDRLFTIGYKFMIIGDDLPIPVAEVGDFESYAHTYKDEDDLMAVLNGATLPSLWTIKGKGGMFTLAGLGGIVISDEAQAVLDSLPGGINAAEVQALINFVNSQSASMGSGNWDLIDSFSHFGTLSALNSLWDWQRESAMTNAGSTHSPGIGRNFTGTDSINTGFDPAISLLNYSLDNGLFGAFVVDITNLGANTHRPISSNRAIMIAQTANNRLRASSNSSSFTNYAGFTMTFPFLGIVSRTAVDLINIYKNGVSVGVSGIVSETIPNEFLIGDSLVGTISSSVIGAGVGFDHADYYDNLVILNAAFAAA